MTTGIIHDQKLEKHIEKHMGCMTGFFQIFDRHQILSRKRLYATKRLTPAVGVKATPVSRELEKPQQTRAISTPSPERGNSSPAPKIQSPATTLPLPIFYCKEGPRSSWKFCKEAPRLSLDSRATVDAKGSLYPKEIRANPVIVSVNRCEDSGDRAMDGDDKRRSPSVIGRLMGLEQLPNSSPEPVKNAELMRSTSESRVSRGFFNHRFVESYNSVEGNKSSNVVLEKV